MIKGTMTPPEYTTDEGLTLRVTASGYLDYGIELLVGSESIFYNPHALSHECYGADFEDADGRWTAEGEPWTRDRWIDCLKEEADDFRECWAPDLTDAEIERKLRMQGLQWSGYATGPYTDPSAAHEAALRVEAAGAKHVRTAKRGDRWQVTYVALQALTFNSERLGS